MGQFHLDRQKLTVAGIVLAVILFVALNVYGSLALRGLRLDLTQNRQFTLSSGTEQLLAKLDGADHAAFLRLARASRRQPVPRLLRRSGARSAAQLCRGLERQDRGRVSSIRSRSRPRRTGQSASVWSRCRSRAARAPAIFGIAGTNSTDDVDVLPTLSPEREPFLEYDLTRMVNNLANPDKPVVALVTGLPLNADPAMQYQPWQVMQELNQFFEVRVQEGDIDRFAEDVGALLLVHPQALSEKTIYAIDQFVMRGGKVLVFVDPHSEAQAMRQQQPGMPGDTFSNLEKLFPAWGVDFDPNTVVGDPAVGSAGVRSRAAGASRWSTICPGCRSTVAIWPQARWSRQSSIGSISARPARWRRTRAPRRPSRR